MNEVNEKVEKAPKTTVAVRLPEVPEHAHRKIKKFRNQLIKEWGRIVTLTEAYYEFLKRAKA